MKVLQTRDARHLCASATDQLAKDPRYLAAPAERQADRQLARSFQYVPAETPASRLATRLREIHGRQSEHTRDRERRLFAVRRSELGRTLVSVKGPAARRGLLRSAPPGSGARCCRSRLQTVAGADRGRSPGRECERRWPRPPYAARPGARLRRADRAASCASGSASRTTPQAFLDVVLASSAKTRNVARRHEPGALFDVTVQLQLLEHDVVRAPAARGRLERRESSFEWRLVGGRQRARASNDGRARCIQRDSRDTVSMYSGCA